MCVLRVGGGGGVFFLGFRGFRGRAQGLGFRVESCEL